MKLPNKFQFRCKRNTGYTHSAKLIEHIGGNTVKVKWARGWHESSEEPWGDDYIWTECTQEKAEEFVGGGGWLIVDQPEAKQEDRSASLPDEFYFKHKYSDILEGIHKAVLTSDVYEIYWSQGSVERRDKKSVSEIVDYGYWQIVDKKPLTAEQLRANKEFREQINALEQSIKLNQQDIAHKERLIASYEERKEFLQSKIVEEF